MEADEGRRPVRGKGEQRIKLKPIFVWKQYNIEPGIIWYQNAKLMHAVVF